MDSTLNQNDILTQNPKCSDWQAHNSPFLRQPECSSSPFCASPTLVFSLTSTKAKRWPNNRCGRLLRAAAFSLSIAHWGIRWAGPDLLSRAGGPALPTVTPRRTSHLCESSTSRLAFSREFSSWESHLSCFVLSRVCVLEPHLHTVQGHLVELCGVLCSVKQCFHFLS